jgi:alpha-1,6-mannosyltransferase
MNANPFQSSACLVDTTMLFTPASGGVKRYLLAKRDWFAANRPAVTHRLVLPAQNPEEDDPGVSWIRSPSLPLGNGYRWPLSTREWAATIEACRPGLIEAGDPYAPGSAALDVGQRLGVPVVGFCHTDISALVGLHFGRWAGSLAMRLWVDKCRLFDAVLAPSQYMANLLREAGIDHARAAPLGVDASCFAPRGNEAEAGALRRRLGVQPGERLLVFAGRNSPEKRVAALVAAVERLGAPYRLLLIGDFRSEARSDRVITLPFQTQTAALARLLAGCDAFVHANPNETLGLIVLEAMACGLPVVGPDAGGVGEIVDEAIGARANGAGAAALAEAIAGVFDRDARALGRAARTRAVERHGWPQAFEGLSRIYAELTGDPRFSRSEFEILAQAGA